MRFTSRGILLGFLLFDVLILTLFAFYTASQAVVLKGNTPIPSWIGISLSSLVFIGSQALFVLPLVKPPTVTSRGRPLFCSILIASFFAALLTTVFACMVLSIIVVLTNGDDKTGMLALCFVGWWGIEWSEFFTLNQSNREMPILIIELSFLVLCWIGWSIPLWIFANRRHRDPGILVRITGKLFAGTIVELLLAIPLTLIIKRRTDCYCATGSFGALIFSLMGCLWLFGPGIVIALFWKKRPWEKDHCFACGYPRKVAASTNCSECGTAFH